MGFALPQSVCPETLVTIRIFYFLGVTNSSLILSEIGFSSRDLPYFIQILYSVHILKGTECL